MAKKRVAAKTGASKTTTKTASSKTKRGPLRILIVEARYYEDIADKLLAGAVAVLEDAGTEFDRLTVPGALEVPPAIAMALDTAAAKRKPYDGVVALGCVIQGETYHFDLVSNESARGLMDLALDRQVPLGNGILTVDNEAQAYARLGGDHGHKGTQAAKAALSMVALKQSLAGA
ncbi:MAG TPA: 6,7-dimethyl-8-ribityllumazine synthase [Pseudolabrys sp.]|jgi:6,7-dimethyl-8-ribityllumazine synthase|nr:6,7-dimethyl-8-ribityllumazine synthase [Pseudolabrys sp.]